MKKYLCLILCILTLAGSLVLTASANMAAPSPSDVGSSITFEKNDDISVRAEVLNITVHGATADIEAIYTMCNTTGETVTTSSMFLSPNLEYSGVTVSANGAEIPFTSESYAFSYSLDIETAGWQFAVLTDAESGWYDEEARVETVAFDLTFAPGETYDVTVAYTYRLGGYPTYTFDAKNGIIEYYLTPAALWKDFSDLTINLYLDKDMPVVKSSSVPFEKVAARTYRYQSHTLPDQDLRIVIDENGIQSFFSHLRSPYLKMELMFNLPFLLIIGGAAVAVVILVHHARRRKK